MNSPRHIDPETRNHIDYFDHIVAYNQGVQEGIAKLLLDKFGENTDDFSIGTVGSDARFEKGPVSPIEVTLFTDGDSKDIVREQLEELVIGDDKRVFWGMIERKDISTDSMTVSNLYSVNGNRITLFSPNRTLDSKLLFGCQSIIDSAKDKLARELTSNEGKAIYGRIKDKVLEHKKTTRFGTQKFKGNLISHYNPEDGVAVYDPDTYTESFKQGPLRFVQYLFVRDAIKTIREGEESTKVLYLPRNTVKKVDKLEVKGMLGISPSQASDLKDNYKFFLWAYHRSQEAYNIGQTKLQFDKKEINDRLNSLASLSSERMIKAGENAYMST